MAHLLIPPQRSETRQGFLLWKKSTVHFQARILKPDQAIGCGISMFRALAAEYPYRKKLEEISALIIGDVETTFHAYESFTRESESNERITRWLLKELPEFSLTFETPEGDIIQDFAYATVDGERISTHFQPMIDDEKNAALERVSTGLQNMIDDHAVNKR